MLIIAAFLALLAAERIELWGLMCFTENGAVTIAQAQLEGGDGLEDAVVEELIKLSESAGHEGEGCERRSRLNTIYGYEVYRGAVIGLRQIVGFAPTADGKPERFGLTNVEPAI